MANLIGALRVSLSADTAQFDAGMKRAQRQAETSSSAITKSLGVVKAGLAGFASALSVGLLANVIKSSLDYAGSLGEMSQQIGVTTRDLQVFRYAAGQNGVAQEELDKGLGKLTITLGQVAAGAKAPTKALDAIGISAKDLAGLDAGAAFRKIADGLAGVTDRAQRAAVEVALFGRTGSKLDTLLAGGSGALNELADAADRLGIVLSDEQIRTADETADKLDALKTVLSAKIAGVVADNAGAILGLANALAVLISKLGTAVRAYQAFAAVSGIAMAKIDALDPTNSKRGRSSARVEVAVQEMRLRDLQNQERGGKSLDERAAAFRAKLLGTKPKAVQAPAGIDQFLAGGGGGGGSKRPKAAKVDHSAEQAERKRLDGIRDAYRADEDMRRADMDILRAKQDLSTDFNERAQLQIQMLDLEKAGYAAELANKVALGDMTKAQADQLQAKYDIVDGLKRQAVLQDEEEQRQRGYEMLEQKTFEVSQGILEKRSGLADTAAERRAVELEILKLAYEEKRRALQHIIDTSKDWAEQEAARRDLAALGTNEALDRQGVMNSTAGPWEQYLKGIPDSAAKMEEAIQSVKVNAVDGLVQGLADAATGAANLGDVFKNVAKQIIADLIRIQLQKAIVGALGKAIGAFGGSTITLAGSGGSAGGPTVPIPQFATGGGFTILGRKGVDRNVMSLNGLPIARVSHGERVNIANDNINAGGGGARVTIMPTPYFDAHVDGRAAKVAAPMAGQAAVMGAQGGTQAITKRASRMLPR